jgi:hypothetical protein
MKGKSGGLLNKVGCKAVYHKEGDCIAGDRVVILCRKPFKYWRESRIMSSKHHIFEGTVRENVIAKLELGYTSTGKK